MPTNTTGDEDSNAFSEVEWNRIGERFELYCLTEVVPRLKGFETWFEISVQDIVRRTKEEAIHWLRSGQGTVTGLREFDREKLLRTIRPIAEGGAAEVPLEARQMLCHIATIFAIQTYVREGCLPAKSFPLDVNLPRSPQGQLSLPTQSLSRKSRNGDRDHHRLLEFTVTAPGELIAGSISLVDVWGHSSSQRGGLMKLVRSVRGQTANIVGSKGPFKVSSGTKIAVELLVPGCSVQPIEDYLEWHGKPANATFSVEVPPSQTFADIACQAILRAEGLTFARIAFVLRVGKQPADVREVSSQLVRYRRAFASYATDDWDAVTARIQGMQKVAPEIDVFTDVLRLRSGERWKVRLEEEILSREVLFLFWSEDASKSKWVDWEWRCAYAMRGIDFIDPVPLASPTDVPPPKELSDLHFHDWMLAFKRR